MRKARFYVEVKVGDSAWSRPNSHGSRWLTHAMDTLKRRREMKDDRGDFVFSAVRIRYRGLTLERWKEGGLCG
jgi:hypothetical protein